jgi:predicted DNA-binding ribbon-helix-helix protein
MKTCAIGGQVLTKRGPKMLRQGSCESLNENEGRRMKSAVLKRSVVIGGHKTSVSLEDEFWGSLKGIAGERNRTLSELVATIDGARQHGNLSSAIRLFVLDHYRSLIPASPDDDRERRDLLPIHSAPSLLDAENPAPVRGAPRD